MLEIDISTSINYRLTLFVNILSFYTLFFKRPKAINMKNNPLKHNVCLKRDKTKSTYYKEDLIACLTSYVYFGFRVSWSLRFKGFKLVQNVTHVRIS